MAIDGKRRLRFLTSLFAVLLTAIPLSAVAQQSPVARVVTRADSQMTPSTVILVESQVDSTLNNDLKPDFHNALELIGRRANDNDAKAIRLIYHAEPFGDRASSDTAVGSVQGDAEGRLDIELKLWSSGGGSSLLQGKNPYETITAGFRLNALLVDGERILWQGYLVTGPEPGDAVSALGPLVQTLIDRLDISVDEIIPLR